MKLFTDDAPSFCNGFSACLDVVNRARAKLFAGTSTPFEMTVSAMLVDAQKNIASSPFLNNAMMLQQLSECVLSAMKTWPGDQSMIDLDTWCALKMGY